jgi:hypothetical protein
MVKRPQTMFDCKDILEGARSIRPFLPDLIGHHADDVDDKLANLLSARDQQEEEVSRSILKILTSKDNTREWIEQFLKLRTTHERQLSQVQEAYSSLPGWQSNVPTVRFACPRGDYVWYQPSVGTPVPRCPTHKLRLVRRP